MAIPLLALAGFSGFVALITNAITSIMRHPIIVKMIMFTLFLFVVKFAIDFFKDMVTQYIVSNQLLAIVSYLGLLDALSVYITIVVAGFGVKQVLAFIRTV